MFNRAIEMHRDIILIEIIPTQTPALKGSRGGEIWNGKISGEI